MIFSNLEPNQVLIAVRYLMAKAGLKDQDNILQLTENGEPTYITGSDDPENNDVPSNDGIDVQTNDEINVPSDDGIPIPGIQDEQGGMSYGL